MLHVVWEGEPGEGNAPPVLTLRQVLDAPIGELSLWLGSDAAHDWPESLRGKCCAPLRELDREHQTALLLEAARVRLQSKAAVFQARAGRQGGSRRCGRIISRNSV